ncbi:hypothetical protein V8C43DRAFT_164359 [Trichoderma afarasin]
MRRVRPANQGVHRTGLSTRHTPAGLWEACGKLTATGISVLLDKALECSCSPTRRHPLRSRLLRRDGARDGVTRAMGVFQNSTNSTSMGSSHTRWATDSVDFGRSSFPGTTLSPWPSRHTAPRPRTLSSWHAVLTFLSCANKAIKHFGPQSRQASPIRAITHSTCSHLHPHDPPGTRNSDSWAWRDNGHGATRIRSCGANVAQAGDSEEKGRIPRMYSVLRTRNLVVERKARDFWFS